MFKKNNQPLTVLQQIANAQHIADNAINVFKQAVANMIDANEELEAIMEREQQKIEEATTNINMAKTKVLLNDSTIVKLKEFIPKE